MGGVAARRDPSGPQGRSTRSGSPAGPPAATTGAATVADASGHDETSYQERLAFAVAGTVLGVTVEPYDRVGRQRAVDAILHYADGRKAALEVSATGPDSEVPIQHYLGHRGHSRTIAGVAGTWVVQLPRTFHPADMRKVEEGLRRCEEREVMHLSELAAAGADLGQLTRQGVRADLIEATGARVHFVLLPDGRTRRRRAGRVS